MRYYQLNGIPLSVETILFLLSCEAIVGRELSDEETAMLVDAAIGHLPEDDLEATIAEQCVCKVLGPQP